MLPVISPSTLLVLLCFILFSSIRTLRWLSIWQTKEYRLDRLLSFLQTPPGKFELVNILPLNFSLTSIKRPVRTPKIYLITLTLIASLTTFTAFFSSIHPIFLVFIYLIIPFFIIFSTIPAYLLTLTFRSYYNHKATSLIKQHQPVIIGITGSYGKTTTKILLTKLLSTKYQVWSSPKSVNTLLSLPQSFVQSYRGQPYVIIEFAAYKQNEISSLTRIFPPHLAILTGITHQHTALFGSLSKLIKAKSELPQALIPNSPLFYNDSDPNLSQLVKKFPHLKTYPLSGLKFTKPHLSANHTLVFNLPPSQLSINTNLVGLHYLPNVLLAITVAKFHKISTSQIKFALSNFRPSDEFIRLHRTPSGITVIIDDKTSNPHGFKAAIDLAASLPADHKAIITSGIVDLGSVSDSIHHQLGIRSSKVFSLFIHSVSTPDPTLKRSLGSKYLHTLNPARIRLLLKNLPGDNTLILIEGKIPDHLHQLILNL